MICSAAFLMLLFLAPSSLSPLEEEEHLGEGPHAWLPGHGAIEGVKRGLDSIDERAEKARCTTLREEAGPCTIVYWNPDHQICDVIYKDCFCGIGKRIEYDSKTCCNCVPDCSDVRLKCRPCPPNTTSSRRNPSAGGDDCCKCFPSNQTFPTLPPGRLTPPTPVPSTSREDCLRRSNLHPCTSTSWDRRRGLCMESKMLCLIRCPPGIPILPPTGENCCGTCDDLLPQPVDPCASIHCDWPKCLDDAVPTTIPGDCCPSCPALHWPTPAPPAFINSGLWQFCSSRPDLPCCERLLRIHALVAGPLSLMDVFYPSCKSDGSFEVMQCGRGRVCYCVNPDDGKAIEPNTRVFDASECRGGTTLA